jgi:hypothetical protein
MRTAESQTGASAARTAEKVGDKLFAIELIGVEKVPEPSYGHSETI